MKEIVASWPDLSHKGEKEKARQSLIELVEGEIERVRAIAAEHEENAGDDAARSRALNGFVFSPKAESMRRWYARAKGSVERGVKGLRQEIRAGRRMAMGRMWHRSPGKMLAHMMGGRRLGGRRTWGVERGETCGRQDGGRRAEDGVLKPAPNMLAKIAVRRRSSNTRGTLVAAGQARLVVRTR